MLAFNRGPFGCHRRLFLHRNADGNQLGCLSVPDNRCPSSGENRALSSLLRLSKNKFSGDRCPLLCNRSAHVPRRCRGTARTAVLFAHATGHRAKRIRGRLPCRGKRGAPDSARSQHGLAPIPFNRLSAV